MSTLNFKDKKTKIGFVIGIILGGIICVGIIFAVEKLVDTLGPQDEIVKMTYVYHGSYSKSYPITDEQTIDKFYTAINNIKTVSETHTIYSDYDEIFIFKTRGKDKFRYEFNGRHLFQDDKYYTLKNDSRLWNLTKKIVNEAD